MRRTPLALAALIVSTCSSLLQAGVDYHSTQGGSTRGYGGRDELSIDVSDQVLKNFNNVLTGGRDCVSDPIAVPNYASNIGEIGEMVVVRGNVRGVVDRLAGCNVLQLLFLDEGQIQGFSFEPPPGNQIWPETWGSMFNRPSGGGSEGDPQRPGSNPSGLPPEEDDPGFDSRLVTVVPEPASLAAFALGAALLMTGNRRRRSNAASRR